jgi:hypothetical protein
MAAVTETYGKEISMSKGGWYQRFLEEAKFNYFAVISMAILIASIWGGITAMVILENNAPIWVLCVNIYITMASNIASIGQAPVKWVVNLFALSMLVNLAIVLCYAF